MSAVSSPVAVARVFISCPGDLASQRGVVSQALATLNRDPEFSGRVELVPYVYENVAPARSGMGAQEVVDSYMLRADDADLVICMLWRRMGTPMTHVTNSATNAPYQSGTEYEYLTAYAANQRLGSPLILLYRCEKPAPDPATPEEQAQLDRVNQFFARFQAGGDLQGLVGDFRGDAELAAVIQRDAASLLRGDLLPLLEQRGAQRAEGPVVFGLPALPAGYVERSGSLDVLRKGLLGSRPQVGVVAATALHGLGGLGKTVLARAICEDPSVRAAFPDGMLWATVGQCPDIARIQREWIRVLGGDLALASSPEGGRAELTRLIGDRAMLLVLDDVWQAEAAAALEVAGPRCRMLITTRDASQAEGATRVPLDLMTPAECRETLRDTALGGTFDDTTLDAIAERLGRLPLALKVVGGLLARGLTWQEITSEMHAGRFPDADKIFEVLDVSVRALPPEQQERYRELVIFPEDESLNTAAIARLWAKTGGLSSVGSKLLLAEFRDRSLIQADDTLHDLQVDYLCATVPAEHVRVLHSALCDAYAAIPAEDASLWSTLPDDDAQYGWRFITTHLSKAGRESDLETLLTDVTWLHGKLARFGSVALVSDLALLPHYEPARLISMTVRAGSLVLDRTPDELMNQLRGRVGPIAELHHTPERQAPYFELYTQSQPQPDPALQGIFAGHNGAVNSCAFSPDGTFVLSGSADQTLRLWEVATGREVRRFEGHSNLVSDCVFSPDGRRALSACADGTLRLWDVASGREVHRFEGHTDTVWDCAFSPDGAFVLSASEDQTLRLWEVATEREVHRFEGNFSPVFCCAFSPDGALVLGACTDGTLRLWDVASGREVHRFEGHAAAFSPDGAFVLSASDDQTLRLWEVATGREVRRFGGHADMVWDCAFSPDGTFVLSGFADGTLRLWEAVSGHEVHRMEGSTGAVNSCAFSPDGALILSACADGTLRLWEAVGGHEVHRMEPHAGTVWDATFSPDGALILSACADGTLRLWEVASGREVRRMDGHTAWVFACAFNSNGTLALSASRDGTLRLWEVASGHEVRRMNGHTDDVTDCALSLDSALALSASRDGTLRLWEVASGRELRCFEGHSGAVNGCAISPDGTLVLSVSSDRSLRLWVMATGAEIALWWNDADIISCAFSPHGDRVAVGDAAGGVHLFKIVGIEPRPLAAPMLQVMMKPEYAPVLDMAATPEPSPAPKPRRKRFWFF